MENRRETGERKIRNRDVAKLIRVLYTMQDVSATEEKRLWQQDRLWNMTQRITGMPGGPGTPKGYEENMAVIGELEETYARECAQYTRELKESENILNSIRSRTMRTFVTARYVLHLPDYEIRKRLNMSRWKFEKACEAVEDAENMTKVKWREKWASDITNVLQND